MLRVAKPTSPMSVGTWIIAGYSPGIGLAAVSELLPARWRGTPAGRLLRRLARPAAVSSAAVAPGAGVLHRGAAVPDRGAGLEHRAPVPAVRVHRLGRGQLRRAGHDRGAGGRGRAGPHLRRPPARPPSWSRPGCMEHRLGLVGEAYTTGPAHRLRQWSEYLTAAGLVGTLAARRSRVAAVASGLALMAGSALQRFGVFEAGVASTRDPRYVVAPQRERHGGPGVSRLAGSGAASISSTASHATG